MTDQTRPSFISWLPYIVAATFFMEYLDTTVIATALPQMARSFGVGPNSLSLGMTAYMLALAMFIPVSGWVADRCGSRTVFFSAIGVFTRGVGVVRHVAERHRVHRRASAARHRRRHDGAGGPADRRTQHREEPPDAGHLHHHVAGDCGAGGRAAGRRLHHDLRVLALDLPAERAVRHRGDGRRVIALVPNLRGTERRPLDFVGLLLSGATLTSILYGAELASQPGENPWIARAVSWRRVWCSGLVAFRHAQRHPHPLIDVSTLKIPTFSVTVVTGSFTRIGIGAVPYLMPLLFQIGFGLSAFKSGLLLLASALGNLGMKALTTRILQRYGFRMVSIVDVAVAGVFTIACGLLTPEVAARAGCCSWCSSMAWRARCSSRRSPPSPMPTSPSRR